MLSTILATLIDIVNIRPVTQEPKLPTVLLTLLPERIAMDTPLATLQLSSPCRPRTWPINLCVSFLPWRPLAMATLSVIAKWFLPVIN